MALLYLNFGLLSPKYEVCVSDYKAELAIFLKKLYDF